MTATLEYVRASRWYGPVIALNDVTTTVGPGVTGLLGPNGAGKSTFLKLAAGQLDKALDILVDDEDSPCPLVPMVLGAWDIIAGKGDLIMGVVACLDEGQVLRAIVDSAFTGLS